VLQTQAALTQALVKPLLYRHQGADRRRIGRTPIPRDLVNASSGVLETIVSQDPSYVLFPVSERQLEDSYTLSVTFRARHRPHINTVNVQTAPRWRSRSSPPR